jgi:hypothetical protein
VKKRQNTKSVPARRARVDANGSICGLQAVQLENPWLRARILPEVGAKIYDLVWKPTGRNFLWCNQRIPPQRYAIEANFDNYWCGGWDEGFPTCDECDFAGDHYPNVGELRSVQWSVNAAEVTSTGALIRLSTFGPISPIRAEKTVIMEHRQPTLRVRYEITNLGPRTLPFIWGTHPALEPSESMILRVPAKTGIVALASDPKLGSPGQRYTWPMFETSSGRVDMSQVLGRDAMINCGHYVTDLEAGWYAVEDVKSGTGFLLKFPLDLCPQLWLWLVYGGWRGYYHIILEPWTSLPVNLAEAVRNKTNRSLAPGEKFSVEVSATIYAKPSSWKHALERLDEFGG